MLELMKPRNLVNYAVACAAFAVAYADQNERDHAALVAAVRAGCIEARTDA